MNKNKITKPLIKITLAREKDKIVKAYVKLKFGKFVIYGYRVKAKDGQLWVDPPCFYDALKKKWRPIVYMPNKSEWQTLERQIINEYEEVLNKEIDKALDEISTEEIDIDNALL